MPSNHSSPASEHTAYRPRREAKRAFRLWKGSQNRGGRYREPGTHRDTIALARHGGTPIHPNHPAGSKRAPFRPRRRSRTPRREGDEDTVTLSYSLFGPASAANVRNPEPEGKKDAGNYHPQPLGTVKEIPSIRRAFPATPALEDPVQPPRSNSTISSAPECKRQLPCPSLGPPQRAGRWRTELRSKFLACFGSSKWADEGMQLRSLLLGGLLKREQFGFEHAITICAFSSLVYNPRMFCGPFGPAQVVFIFNKVVGNVFT